MNIDLQGLRILNTRPQPSAKYLTQLIEKAHGISIEYPILSIEAHPFRLPHPSRSYDIAIFISPNAVDYFFKKYIPSDWSPNGITLALGRGTAEQLSTYHISCSAYPAVENSESLIQMQPLQSIRNRSIMLVKGVGGRTLIEDTLSKRGAFVDIFQTYQRKPLPIDPFTSNILWQDDAVDIILITSHESMVHLMRRFQKPEKKIWITQKPWLVISDRLATCAKAFGINKTFVAPIHDIIPALRLIKEKLHAKT